MVMINITYIRIIQLNLWNEVYNISLFRYRIVTDLSSRVNFLNPPINTDSAVIDQQFLKAVELCGQDFVEHVKYTINEWLPCRSDIEQVICNRFEVKIFT